MTTGGLLVVVLTLILTGAGWLLAVYTRRQLVAHLAARDRPTASTPSSAAPPPATSDLDLPIPLVGGAMIYRTKGDAAGIVIAEAGRARKVTLREG